MGTYGIYEFQSAEEAKIKRLERRDKAFKLGQAAIAAAESKGASTIVHGPDEWGQTHAWIQTPFVTSPGPEKAIRKKVDSGIKDSYLVLKIDEHNTAIYAKVGSDQGEIQYGAEQHNVALSDREVVNAYLDIARAMGVDVNQPKFDTEPVMVPERPF